MDDTILRVVRPEELPQEPPRPPQVHSDAPLWLDGDALDFYEDLKRPLEAKRLMTPTDRQALAVLATELVQYVEAVQRLEEQGMEVVGGNGSPVLNRNWTISRDAVGSIIRLFKEFGMTPAARVAMVGPMLDAQGVPKNAIERLLS